MLHNINLDNDDKLIIETLQCQTTAFVNHCHEKYKIGEWVPNLNMEKKAPKRKLAKQIRQNYPKKPKSE